MFTVLASVLVLVTSSSALSPYHPVLLRQDPPVASEGTLFPNQLDLSVPYATAQIALGLSPSDVQAPSSLYKSALGYIRGTDKDGLFKDGFSVSGSLQSLGQFNDLGRYLSSGSYRRWANTHISAALVRGSTQDDPSMRLAVGLSIPVIDHTDWRGSEQADAEFDEFINREIPMQVHALPSLPYGYDGTQQSLADWVTSESFRADQVNLVSSDAELVVTDLRAILESRHLTAAEFDRIGEDVAGLVKRIEEQVTAIREYARSGAIDPASGVVKSWRTLSTDVNAFIAKWSDGAEALNARVYSKVVDEQWRAFAEKMDQESWAKTRLDLAFATTLFSETADASDFKSDGTFAWLSYSSGVSDGGQVTLMVRYINGDRKWNEGTETYDRANGFSLGGRLRMGGATSGLYAEYLYSRIARNGGGWNNERIVRIGYEQQVDSSLWLQISMGNSREDSQSGKSVLGLSFNYRLSEKRLLDRPKSS